MARGIQIPFTLDVRQWRKGIKRVELDLDDLGDEFRDLERDADRAADDIEDSFRDIGRAAERAGDDVDRNLRGGMDGTGRDVGGEIGEEFVESWGEAVRAGNPAEAIYETITNAGNIAAQTLPLAGAVIGMGVALIGGVVNGMRQAAAERQQEIKDAASNLLDAFRDQAGEQGGLTWGAFRDGFIDAQARDQLLTDALSAGSLYEALDEIQQIGAAAGESIARDLVIALQDTGPAGEAAAQRIRDAYAAAQDAVKAKQDEINQTIEDGGPAAELLIPVLEAQKAELQANVDEIDKANQLIADQQSSFDDTRGKVGLLNEALRQTAQDLINAKVQAGNLDSALAFRNTPDFAYLVSQLGYASANAWSLSAALGTVTSQSQLKGIAVGALLR